ncbi:MAG: MotA/TolQ/ExbB proton channel family protein [Bacteroidetes bacterium]|nr:MotA/TolQ/ExbB proton channel family protein [Bacteroidota bacterium]
MLLDGEIDAALSMCRSSNTPIARLLEKGIKRLGKPVKEIESAVENTGKLEIYKLEKNLSYLGIIAGIAPMLGFIGTISGVINIFIKFQFPLTLDTADF